MVVHTLFVIFMIYPLIYRLASASRFRMLAVCAVLFILSSYGLDIKAFEIKQTAYYMFFFHAGVTVKYIFGGKLPVMKYHVILIPVMLCTWLVLLFWTQGLEPVTAIIGIITCWLMSKHKIFKQIFSRFGEYSLQLYLFNGITLGISRAIICNVLHVSQPVTIITFNMLIDFLASYLLIKYVLVKGKAIRVMMGIV